MGVILGLVQEYLSDKLSDYVVDGKLTDEAKTTIKSILLTKIGDFILNSAPVLAPPTKPVFMVIQGVMKIDISNTVQDKYNEIIGKIFNGLVDNIINKIEEKIKLKDKSKFGKRNRKCDLKVLFKNCKKIKFKTVIHKGKRENKIICTPKKR